MANQPENPDPLANALETLRELRGTVGVLYDRLLEANNQIGRLDQENILLRFEIEQQEAELRALRGLNPVPPEAELQAPRGLNPVPPVGGADVQVAAPLNDGPDLQNEPAPTSDDWTALSGGARA